MLNTHPLVTVIVPTRNAAATLDRSLASIARQTYRNLELLVVDNDSTDSTREIALRYTPRIYTHGPERSAQANYGAACASGQYVYKVDADFVLDPEVIRSCVTEASRGFDAVVVHNSPDVSVSWIARVRKFEVDMYKYDIVHSSARFVKREVFLAVGGYNERLIAGEDYDFQNRLNRAGYRTGFVEPEAIHLGEPTSLWKHLHKYFEYGRDFAHFRAANPEESKEQLRFIRRVYLRHWRSFARHPVMAGKFAIYNSLKYLFGGAGLLAALVRPRHVGAALR